MAIINKRPLFVALLLLFLQFGFSQLSYADLKVKVGIYNNEPLIFADADSKGTGFFADVLEDIASKEGWQIEYVPGTWQQCLARLENSQIDLLCVIAFSKERDKLYDFNKENMLTNWGQLYTPAGSDIRAITDIAGKRIAVLKNDIHYSVFSQIMDSFGIQSQIIETDNYESVLDLITQNQVDAGVVNRFFGMKYQNKYHVEKSGIIFNPIKIHYAVPKGKNQAIITALDQHLISLKNDHNSIYYHFLDKWLGTVTPKGIIPLWIKWVLLAIIGFIALLFAGTIILKKQVRVKTYELSSELNLRKKIEQKLRKSEEHYRRLFDMLPYGAELIDSNGNIIDCNPNTASMLGYKQEELIGKHITTVFDTDSMDTFHEKFSSIKKGNIEQADITMVHKDGSKVEVIRTGQLVYINSKAKPTSLLCVSIDVSRRKQIEKALKESEEKYRTMIEHSNDLIWTLNKTGELTFFNKQVEEVTGLTQKEWIGKSFVPLIMEDDLQMISDIFQKSLKGESLQYELRFKKENGKMLTIAVNTAPIWKNEKVNGIVSFGRDITEQNKLKARLQLVQKMEAIGTLAGGIAHDFNNILFPIVGYTQMLLEDVPQDSPFRKSLDGIYTSALRAKDLVTQILTFAREETGQLKLMKMQLIIKEVLKLIRSSIPTTINITQDIQTDCGVIKADPTQIHQIIMNLATNAYHAMEETGGELKVSLKEINLGEFDLIGPGTYACLIISDTGKGMDKELTDKIFDPFFTTKEKGKGTGMGLSVVHGIVTTMQGTIRVYSEPGQGTQFQVYLPIVKTMKKQLRNTNTKISIEGGSEHILLVDDEKTIIEMEKEMLERLGYRVTSRTSSIEALEAFRINHAKFDLVITDMAMPNLSGDNFAMELTKIRPDIPILLCTGFSETMSEEKAASIGIKDFLLKPIVMQDLSHKIREVLDKNKI